MDPNVRLQEDEGEKLEDVTMYQQLAGSLIYLTLTRPDISYPIGVVSQYMSDPKKPTLDAVRRILRYVKGTINFGILYKKAKDCQVIGYCDADTLEIVPHDDQPRDSSLVLDQEPYHGAIKDNLTVALSSTEAEYRSPTKAAQ
jgi:hypothetical protein